MIKWTRLRRSPQKYAAGDSFKINIIYKTGVPDTNIIQLYQLFFNFFQTQLKTFVGFKEQIWRV